MSGEALRHWWVTGYPSGYYEGDGRYWIEDGVECASVAAPTSTAAKWAALKTAAFKDHRGDSWPKHPLTGMKAEDARCPPGVCWCDIRDAAGKLAHPDQPEVCAGCCGETGHKMEDDQAECWCGERKTAEVNA